MTSQGHVSKDLLPQTWLFYQGFRSCKRLFTQATIINCALFLAGLWVPDARSAGLTPANEQLKKELEEQGQLPVEEEYDDVDDLGLD